MLTKPIIFVPTVLFISFFWANFTNCKQNVKFGFFFAFFFFYVLHKIKQSGNRPQRQISVPLDAAADVFPSLSFLVFIDKFPEYVILNISKKGAPL